MPKLRWIIEGYTDDTIIWRSARDVNWRIVQLNINKSLLQCIRGDGVEEFFNIKVQDKYMSGHVCSEDKNIVWHLLNDLVLHCPYEIDEEAKKTLEKMGVA